MKKQRLGFTLVELLVVITIIGILMGLLIPAVNSARETARARECSTKIKNLSLAAIQHENSKGALPGWVNDFGTFAGGADPADVAGGAVVIPPHRKVGTWTVALMPWLDAQPTYERWTQDRYPVITLPGGDFEPTENEAGDGFHPEAAPNLAIMQCASNPVEIVDNGRNSYVSNNGFSHIRQVTLPGTTRAATASYKNSMTRDNGAFVAKYDGNGFPAGASATPEVETGPDVRLDDFKDGQGNTILFTENVQAGPWHRAGFLNGTGATNSLVTLAADGNLNTAPTAAFSQALRDSRFTTGAVWHFEDPQAATLPGSPVTASGLPPIAVLDMHSINGGGTDVGDDIFVLEIKQSNCVHVARPSSAHVDGVNAAMADGGTRFLSQSIDYRVYQALMTPRGKASDVPWPEYVLNDESL